MTPDSWLPIGFALPDGTRCGRPLHADAHWQILDARDGGKALIVTEDLFAKWAAAGLTGEAEFPVFSFGSDSFRELFCASDQMLAPLSDCRSPNNKNEALAFAAALRQTRAIDPHTPLQDAIYVAKLARLLPTFGGTAPAGDDVVLGQWLTGGAGVSVRSFRRLQQMLTWLGAQDLLDVVDSAGMGASEGSSTFGFRAAQASDQDGVPLSDARTPSASARQGGGVASDKAFELPGRPELEAFFNEHVVDIVRNQARYKALGVGFPSAIVLHGPPGCGKTYAVEQLIEFLGWPAIQIDASAVASAFIHETSRKISDVFAKAMQIAPCVLVIDEMEAFLADRESGGGGGHHRVEELAEFLRRIPEAARNEVLIIAMTNRLDMIDSAIMRRGRFDHVIKVDYAKEDEVLALLNKLLVTLPKDETIDPLPLSLRLAGRPLSDVTFVVREGARLSARAGRDALAQDFLLAALDATPSRDGDNAGPRIGFV